MHAAPTAIDSLAVRLDAMSLDVRSELDGIRLLARLALQAAPSGNPALIADALKAIEERAAFCASLLDGESSALVEAAAQH